MSFIDSRWYYLYVGVFAALVVVVISLIAGRDVNWFGAVFIGLAAAAGSVVGRRLRGQRSD